MFTPSLLFEYSHIVSLQIISNPISFSFANCRYKRMSDAKNLRNKSEEDLTAILGTGSRRNVENNEVGEEGSNEEERNSSDDLPIATKTSKSSKSKKEKKAKKEKKEKKGKKEKKEKKERK